MLFNKSPYLNVSYYLEGRDEDGNQIYDAFIEDQLVVNTGKVENLNWIGHLSALAAPSGFTFLGYGASSITPDVTHTKLGGTSGHEYIYAGARETITDWTVSAETYVYSGLTFTEKMVGSKTIGPGSPNGPLPPTTNPINMVGLFSTWVLPSSAGGTSGIMFDEIELDDTFNLTSLNSLTITVVIRQ